MRIGIDFGNAYLKAASIWGSAGKYPTIIPDYHSRQASPTPSVLYLNESGTLIGEWTQKLEAQILNNYEIHKNFKSMLGHNSQELWSAESLTALLFRKILFEAKQYANGTSPEGIVLTHPFYFNAQQRTALYHAAAIADLPVIDLIPEAEAVALYYGWRQSPQAESSLILDWGQEALQISILQLSDNQEIQTVAYTRLMNLGGNKIIGELRSLLKQELQKQDIYVKDTLQVQRQLFRTAEIWLKDFGNPKAQVLWLDFLDTVVNFYTQDALVLKVLESFAIDAFNELQNFLTVNQFTFDNFSQAFFAGGLFENTLLYNFFKLRLQNEIKSLQCQKPMEAVAKGAAYYASTQNILSKRSTQELQNKSSMFIGIRIYDTRQKKNITLPIIQKNDPLNHAFTQKVYIKANQKRLAIELVQYDENPEELIGIGILEINPLPQASQSFAVDIILEKKSNGTLKVIVSNNQIGLYKEETFEEMSEENIEALSQKRELVSKTLINDFFGI